MKDAWGNKLVRTSFKINFGAIHSYPGHPPPLLLSMSSAVNTVLPHLDVQPLEK